MIKCRIHIKNDVAFNDDNIHINIKLPALPRKGEIIHIPEELWKLTEYARNNREIAKEYFPKWFYGRKYDWQEEITQEILQKLSFCDAIYVKQVTYTSGEDFVRIELDK